MDVGATGEDQVYLAQTLAKCNFRNSGILK
jgi:hypothetical protein